MSTIKSLSQMLGSGESLPDSQWELRSIQSEQCISYVVSNSRTKEALLIDPKREDLAAYRSLASDLRGFLWLGVVDTHTHADHVSAAADMAAELKVPLIMSARSGSRRVDVRIARDTALPAHAGLVQFLATPGHTEDSLTVIWGPFLFGGDTLLYGDTGRDDLPGGDPEAHFASLQKIKQRVTQDMIVLHGHDHQSARASSFRTQLKVNSSLTLEREEFVREASSFNAPAPKLLKESLRENLR